ncbi:HAD family hydrolase [Cohnella zeiphila]|uniref:HAD family hydrolase n=1 Tax=Cohnella zeiphila TaxID=2761120 RepID=A0A7X0VVT2_9BACL|nr:HAD family hydrolase [Cohnella zeiphila]MBB6731770.1 HAD family hydrolase [Cohnella zeiphila]
MMRALVFDFDGTILDTETAWYEAFREAYSEHGVDLTLEMYSQCIGTSLHRFNPYEYLMTERGLPLDKDRFRESVHLRHSELMRREEVRPGVLSYLEAAKEYGMKIGLASSSTREWVDKHLRQLGIESYFETVRTADDVRQVKPDPELYVLALSDLGVDGREAIAVEDSPNGARAAISAGMHCVLAPNRITSLLDFPATGIAHRLGTLEDLEFRRLIASSSQF